MLELMAIGQGLNALKATSDIVKAMVGLRDQAQILENTIKLTTQITSIQNALFNAQQEQAALVKQIDGLNSKIASMEKWEAEKNRYQLKKLPPGVYVYSLKPDAAGEEEAHYICQTCYQRGKKSILNKDEDWNGTYNLMCNECDKNLAVGISASRAHQADWDPRSSYDKF
jgi:cell division protein FtsB